MFGVRRTLHINHLGGIDASYHISDPFDPNNPTLVLINSFTTTADLYEPQFNDKKLADKLNLLAIEPLGHGGTRLKSNTSDTFTYWDTAIMNLQVMDSLKIPQAFVLGTSQGAWVAVRMALLNPDKILGLVLLGSSLDSESKASRDLGCWDVEKQLASVIKLTSFKYASEPWELPSGMADAVNLSGFGDGIIEEQKVIWAKRIMKNYAGDDGRRRIRQAAINLKDRDGLHSRLSDLTTPVLWTHGDKDVVYSIKHAEKEMELLKHMKDINFVIVKGGAHYLNATNPKEVNAVVLNFVNGHQSKL